MQRRRWDRFESILKDAMQQFAAQHTRRIQSQNEKNCKDIWLAFHNLPRIHKWVNSIAAYVQS